MTYTFNTESYTELLIRYQPKPIATEAENQRAIALAQELEHRSIRSLEEETFLELLITLIEKFEAEHDPIPPGTTGSMLRHLMDARDLAADDLVVVLETPKNVTEILNDIRPIQLDEAKKLAEFFRVDLSLLTSETI